MEAVMKANVILLLLVSVLIGGCSAHNKLINHERETVKPDYCGDDHKKCKGGKLGKNTADELRKKLKEIETDPQNPLFDELALILLVDSHGRMATFYPEDTDTIIKDQDTTGKEILGKTTSFEITPYRGSHCLYVVYKLNMSGTGYQSYCMIPGRH